MGADPAKSERTIAERVVIRWPNVAVRTNRSVLRLPPGSRVRNLLLRRAARIAFESWNRGDFALVPYIDDPEIETHVMEGTGAALGFDSVYYGPEGHCRTMQLWNEAWREWSAEIDEIIDEGHDQILILARVHCVGAASGVVLDEWSGARYTFRDGRILRVDGAFHADRDGVIRALGTQL